MKIGLLRTVALCATCAALAGAGSAALAADDDGPGTSAAPGKPAGQGFTIRTCVMQSADEADKTDGAGDEVCKITSGDGPPPGGKPPFGGCAVRVERGTSDKPVDEVAAKRKLAAVAKEKCGKPPSGGCMKAEPGPGAKAADAAAAKAKKAAIAKEQAAAVAGSA